MKKFIKEYIKMISYIAIGLVLILTSFYLIINYYHSEELKKTIYVGNNDIYYQSYKDKIDKLNNNLDKFKNKKINNKAYEKMYNNLQRCRTVLNKEGTLGKMKTDVYLKPYDIYTLAANFQNDILNVCWALQLSYLTDSAPDEFKNVAPFVKDSVNMISNETNYAIAELQNNGSYFFSTNVTSATIRNYLSTDYTIIARSYNEFADIILNLSEIINEGAGTND